MNRKLIVVFYILFPVIFTLEVQAQKIVIRMNNGEEDISNLIDVQKLYFSGNQMVVDYYSGPDDTYGISDVSKIYFDTGVSLVENNDPLANGIKVYPNPAGEFITISGIPDLEGNLSIYSMDGRLVLVMVISTSHESIDVSRLPQGLYLVNVPGLTTKFVKR